MALSPKTVVYQETVNDYTETRQRIKGAQITSIKLVGMAPVTAGEHIGQFALGSPDGTVQNLYIWTGTEWAHVGSSSSIDLPDTVVREDIDNNFVHPNQRILDCPITYLDTGMGVPTTGMIKGPGHMYVQTVTPEKVYVTYDGMDWIQLRTHDDTGDYVVCDKPNDFTDNDQTIGMRPIVSAIQHSVDPTVAGITPDRIGQIFVQLKDGTTDGRAKMWIANPDGGLHWEEVVAPVPTMVRTDRDNDFAVVEQKLNGKQILSFIDGGDQTPGQSGLRPDYDGQMYLAVKTLGTGDKSVGVWVAHGTSWLPILEDTMSSQFVRKDQSNIFGVPEQYLGAGDQARQITGARIKYGGLAPIADSTWRTNCVGEVTIWHNDNTTPVEYSAWMSVLKNPDPLSNSGEWQLIWSSKAGSLDDYAVTNRSNVFASEQFINDGVKNHLITVAREGSTYEPDNNVAPMSAGEVYSQNVGGGQKHLLWMSYAAGDARSWRRLITTEDPAVAWVGEPNTFTDNDQFMVGPSGKKDRIVGAKMAKPTGTGSFTGPAPGLITPSAFGEIVICEQYEKPGDNTTPLTMVAYIACGVTKDHWIEIGRMAKGGLLATGDPSNPQ